ncbi:MAG: phospho-N-acetylmuramoyl-pentapeptide-transferase [Bacteroidales bacterium]
MFYHLFNYLDSIMDFHGSGLFKYISTRALAANAVALIIAIIWGKSLIKKLKRKQISDEIRNLGLEGQISKKGTPTMGGLIVILSILIPVLLFCDLTNIYVQLLLLTTVWLGAVGFLDDYIKVFKKNKEGLRPKYKIFGQVTLGLIIGLVLYLNSDVVIYEKTIPKTTTIEQTVIPVLDKMDTETKIVEESTINDSHTCKSTITTIPFVKNNEFDYAWLALGKGKVKNALQWIIYILVIIFIITGVSNGTNLTDGLDGLTTGVSAIIGAGLGILAYLSGNIIYSDYLNIMYLPGTGETVVFLSAFIGALLGFLWYNSYPAQIFMGDTGSLAIGGIIAVSSILIRKELLLPILCGIFLVESLSVIIQRVYFKYTKKKHGAGVRVFRMSPLHHHYQKENKDAILQKPKGVIPEAKIVMRFWLIDILLVIITIATLKIR